MSRPKCVRVSSGTDIKGLASVIGFKLQQPNQYRACLDVGQTSKSKLNGVGRLCAFVKGYVNGWLVCWHPDQLRMYPLEGDTNSAPILKLDTSP